MIGRLTQELIDDDIVTSKAFEMLGQIVAERIDRQILCDHTLLTDLGDCVDCGARNIGPATRIDFARIKSIFDKLKR